MTLVSTGPRAATDARMFLYFDYGPEPERRVRWYVKVSRKGRRIGIAEEYDTDAFDLAYEAAVFALGGVLKMRRTERESAVQPERRYLHADVSDSGQLRYYVQLRNKLPKIRIRGEYGSVDFNLAVDAAILEQIAEFGDESDHPNAQKQRYDVIELPTTQPKPGTFRYYWMLYKVSDRCLGNLSIGEKGLKASTMEGRRGLINPLLLKNGEKLIRVLTRAAIREEMKLTTPTQAGNLLAGLRHFFTFLYDEGHLNEDDFENPTIGLKSGKSAASRESGGFVPWTEEDMAKYRAKWALGTEARLMFDVLHYTYLRRGDAARFGKNHLKKIMREAVVQIETEKSGSRRTVVEIKVHPNFAASLKAARVTGILGDGDVFTGKLIKGEVVPMSAEGWAAKFKKYARLAGVNANKKCCHGVRKARAEDAAYSQCTEAEMMAMFGWTDPKMPALYIAAARRSVLGMSGSDKMIAFDQRETLDDLFLPAGDSNVVALTGHRRA
jgi:hypothetical protein